MNRVMRWLGVGLGAPVALVLLAAGVVWLRNYPWPVEPERVTFQSGAVELVGVLLKPEGEGPHPAVIFLSGAECGTKDRLVNRVFANAFVPRGFALLSYDKRGCGESGGDHDAAELPDLAADAAAAVRLLRGRSDIRGDAIGMLGGSQSGWFTPQVAVEEPGVAFVINSSGPPLVWAETVRFEARNDLRAAGVEDATIDGILALKERTWEYYRQAAVDPEYALGPERQALEAEIARAREANWHEHFNIGLLEYDPDLYAAWCSTIFYDPRPWLERLEVPLLAVYGAKDINVPAERSAALLRELAAAPGRDFTVVVFDDLGHQMQRWSAPGRVGFFYLDEMAEFAGAAISPPPAGAR